MRVLQTISELGLEKGVITLWSEPRAGQRLKPRFGSRPFPKKSLCVLLILETYFFVWLLANGNTLSNPMLVLVAIAIATAWPLVIALDRLTSRNVWVYADRILITHARARSVLQKEEIKQVFVYHVKKSTLNVVEFLSVRGISTVIAMTEEMEVSGFVACLRKLGYSVENRL